MNNIDNMNNNMYKSMENLRQYEFTKNVGLRWTKNEENQLIDELTIQKLDLTTISRIHGRTIRGITERRNLLIHSDFKNSCNIKDLSIKYLISELECFAILQKCKEKEVKKLQKIDIKNNDVYSERLDKLEIEVQNMNKTLIEIRDLLAKQNNFNMLPNNLSNNPFDELEIKN